MRIGRNLGTAGLLLLVLTLGAQAGTPGKEVEGWLAQLKAVGREGASNAEAQTAWRELVRQGPKVLIPLLESWDEKNPAAGNWLRTAVDTIAEGEVQAGRSLPVAQLEAFIRETGHAGQARRLAYEWLQRVDPSAPGRLLPGMLHDPSVELRRDAVAMVLQEAQGLLERGDRRAATEAYEKALSGACEKDQVDLIARQLRTLGKEVDLAEHFGFLREWSLLGPFDNSGGKGYDTTYPPEQKVDLGGTYPGKNGAGIRWTACHTTDSYGLVDLNKVVGKHHGEVVYALAVVSSPSERPVQIRAGSDNAVKIFLNGKLLFSRHEYHHGMRMDQHVAEGRLQGGRNEILIKVCQNEQTEDWAQAWAFQLRVCDAVGVKVPLSVLGNKDQARSAGREVRQ